MLEEIIHVHATIVQIWSKIIQKTRFPQKTANFWKKAKTPIFLIIFFAPTQG